MERTKVFVIKTAPETVIEDYAKLMHISEYQNILPKNSDIIIKLNLPWTKFYPACSSWPWQLEGVIKTLLEDGYNRQMIYPVENKTSAANPKLGVFNNKWTRVLKKYDLDFMSLADTEWVKYEFQDELSILPRLFPQGVRVPKMFIGKSIVHLPTMKPHGHSIIAGAVENALSGLSKESRYYGQKYIHQVLVDLMTIQKRIHPVVFAVMDATICGDRCGPRTAKPRICNYLLAGSDSVALDSVASKMMGFEPESIDYIRMADAKGLGCGRIKDIEIVGEDIKDVNLHFKVRKNPLKIFECYFLHARIVNIFAAAVFGLCRDGLWYPAIGRRRVGRFMQTDWGRLFSGY